MCRRTLFKIGLLLFSTTITLALGEVFLRWQKPKPAGPVPDSTDGATACLAALLNDTERAWFESDPPPLPRHPVQDEHRRRLALVHNFVVNCSINENFMKQDPARVAEYLPFADQVEMQTFAAPWGAVEPPYRLPPSTTLPCGVTTNKFGFRGPEIDYVKPPRTVRIACVGASTTISAHADRWSYPEHLQHWLNLWSEQRQAPVRFEVINAARSGIRSSAIAAIVKYEVLPLDVDYVIYYEGSNQFWPRTLVHTEKGASKLPKKGMLEHLELTKRLSLFLSAPGGQLAEPRKPPQEFVLPEGVDEMNPQRAQVESVLNLRDILRDLDQIRADTRGQDVKLLMSTFCWLAYDGMKLDKQRHLGIYKYLNGNYWPVTYENMRRAAALQNRVFQNWARDGDVPLLEVAARMPQDPDLYIDGIHNSPPGTRVRAWIVFQGLRPMLERDIAAGVVPRASRQKDERHPFIHSSDLASDSAAGE